MGSKFAGYVMRAKTRELTRSFYTALGLSCTDHEHGGPVHSEVGPASDNCVLEIYQHSKRFNCDALMIEVESLEFTLESVSGFEVKLRSDIITNLNSRLVYLEDPDSRLVLLVERI